MNDAWDLARIQRYIDAEIQESLVLEYKAADAIGRIDGKKKEITKDVSAMANSAGGIIIYGVREYQQSDKKGLPEKIDPIDQIQFSKEWLEDVLGNIRPRIEGLRIHSIPIGSGANLVVYVVEIPQSTTAHQAADWRYYKRLNFESVPMEDYEIRDVMGRNQRPIIDLEFVVESRKILFIVPIAKRVELVIKAKNMGQIYAQYVNCLIHLPATLATHKVSFFDRDIVTIDGETYYTLVKNNTQRDTLEVGEGTRTLGTSWFDPVLPSRDHTWRWNLPNSFDELSLRSSGEKILWEVHADNAPRRAGSTRVQDVRFVDRNESLYRIIKVAVIQNKLRLTVFLLLIGISTLYLFYNALRLR